MLKQRDSSWMSFQTLRSGLFFKGIFFSFERTHCPQDPSHPLQLPSLSPCHASLCLHMFDAALFWGTILKRRRTLDPIRWHRGKRRADMFLWFLLFFSFLIKAFKDTLCAGVWRLNLTPWATHVVVGWGRVGCEELRKELGSRISFSSAANWSNVLWFPELVHEICILEKLHLMLAGHRFYVYESWVLVFCVLFPQMFHVFWIILSSPSPQ